MTLLAGLWEYFGQRCGKLLCPMLRAMLPFILADENWTVSAEDQALLLTVSPSTIDRLLRPVKKKRWPYGKSLTKPGPLLKHQIPIKPYFTWDELKPGFFELDTVSHCGTSTSGEFCRTLTLTDVSSGWTEERALRNSAHRWVKEQVAAVRSSLPFPLLGIDSDNGREFINHQLLAFCTEHHIQFTRSRPYRKNDNCFVEQKNGDVVRKNVGYHRYDTGEECAALAGVYRFLCPLINFWYPTIKTVGKLKLENGRYKKIREKTPKTPYQRLLESPARYRTRIPISSLVRRWGSRKTSEKGTDQRSESRSFTGMIVFHWYPP
ncbi:MAG: transposase family protein [Spirochaetaceae bacterium]|nr:transposase family protein [Spirochaetaceae bacterium]